MNQQVNQQGRSVREITETIALTLTIGISIIVSLLDFSGLLDGVPWLGERIPTLTLLFVGLTATYLALERRGAIEALISTHRSNHDQTIKEIQESTSKLITALNGVEFRQYRNASDFYISFTTRLHRARKLEFTYWGDWGNAASQLTGEDLEHITRYHDALQKLRERKNAIVREIRIFSIGKPFYDKLEQNLRLNLPGYSVSCYAISPNNTPRNITFHIIDDEELFLVGERRWISVKHPEIVRFFADYYELSWQKGSILSKGTKYNERALDQFKALLQDQREAL